VEGGIHRNAVGRSRGGLTTKVHTRANAEGLAVGFVVTPGQASDTTSYDDLMAEDAPPPTTKGAKNVHSSSLISPRSTAALLKKQR
jgi:hypothetical protein